MCVDADDNELETLEIIHHYVEILDRYFGNVSVSTFQRKPTHCFAGRSFAVLLLYYKLLVIDDSRKSY